MAVYTPVDLPAAEAIARTYSLVGVTSVEPVAAGSVNSNFYLSVGGHDLFLRIYEEAGPDGARYEALLASHLAGHGVPTPVPLRTRAGGFFAEHAGKPAALFPRVHGETLCQARVTSEHARRVGALVARLHAAAADFPDRRAGRFTSDDVASRLDGVAALGRADLVPTVARLRAELSRLRARRRAELPRGTVHGDLFRDNVLWQGGEVAAVLDFESASVDTYVYDLAVAVLSWCFGDGLDLSLARALCEGYQALRPLSDDERAAFADEARAACVRFATTRITDVFLRDPSPGPRRKDYRRFLARLEALAGMGDFPPQRG